jgi:hypothetical protein
MVANAMPELRQWCEANLHDKLFRALLAPIEALPTPPRKTAGNGGQVLRMQAPRLK